MSKYDSYIDAWKRRLTQRERHLTKRKHADRALANAIAKDLREKMGAKRVFLFGSVIDGGVYDETSDIDLAVEGIPPDQYLDVYGVVESKFEGRQFDLVLLETASDSLRTVVFERGVEI